MGLVVMGGGWQTLKEVIECGEEEKIDIDNGGGDIWCWVSKKKKNWRRYSGGEEQNQ